MTHRAGDDARPTSGSAIHVAGIVQGVGFRPFVYGLALRHGLSGWVLNNSSGVSIRVFGSEDSLLAFASDLAAEAPPLAVIDQLDVLPLTPAEIDAARNAGALAGFSIRESEDQPQSFVPVSPDVATCPECLNDLWDPGNRRFRYPFTNCTNCGPRFTIVRAIPYDRPNTTMAPFRMCDQCQSEYDDPGDRRFHAQPNACPVCGPQLRLVVSSHANQDTATETGTDLRGDDALRAARRLIDEGKIVAVKGLGGYHLSCNAADDNAVRTLRDRKGRIGKPFAVMAPNLDAVRSFAIVSGDDASLLRMRTAPIVLLPKRDDCWLSEHVAPGNRMIGVMLPYTPLHHLLLESPTQMSDSHVRPPVFVMTSGNLSEEPIVKDDDEALARLASIADAFLQHNREIYVHCDDSVVRSFRGQPTPIRRARGYAPAPIRLPVSLPPILAVGGELKNTFCLTNGDYAFMSQHIGDMENLETLRAFEQVVAHYTKIFRVEPAMLACDMHPRYLSTRWASAYADEHDLPLIEVQHHHAHIAAVMAEHGLSTEQSVIGVALDGTGYGPDATIWGGEFLVANYAEYVRAGHLRVAPLPGGDAAIRRPYRMALAYLWDAGVDWNELLPPVQTASPEEQRILQRQLEAGLNTVGTSSMGRLFDAVASIAGIRHTVSYEAQAAMEMEALAVTAERGPCPISPYELEITPLKPERTKIGAAVQPSPNLQSLSAELQFEIDPRPLIRQIADDVVRGTSPEAISARFHATVAMIVRDACRHIRHRTGLEQVALSGGVFQNMVLLTLVVDMLEEAGFETLVHYRVPTNDGGIALGQAMVAQYAKRP
ncbi:MAG: carbamoyltransferase HypF [Caldilineaceae bacterium]